MNASEHIPKDMAVNFLQMIVSGNINEAYEKYVDMNGKHHNMYYAGDFATLMQGMKDNEVQFPSKAFHIKQIFTDGNRVAVHSHVILEKDTPGIAVVHMFLFENGKIVELWDVGQMLQSDSPNNNGAF
jgi:predicted SnoaL-like aldol condensation-catalyzing enzyme